MLRVRDVRLELRMLIIFCMAAWCLLLFGRVSLKVFDAEFSIPQFRLSIISRFGRLDANDTGPGREVCCISVVWVPPSEGLVKLNVDDSCDGDLGTITAGGVLQNHLKEWLRGFVLNKGIESVHETELWGMFEGLTMAWNYGFRCVIVETDSLSTVQLLNYPLFSYGFRVAKGSLLQIGIVG